MFLALSVLAVVILGILIMYVYTRRPAYGITLLSATLILAGILSLWSINDSKLKQRKTERVETTQLQLTQQTLAVAYGNYYLFEAKAQNQSDKYTISRVDFSLEIDCSADKKAVQSECMIKSEKQARLWLEPGSQKNIQVYFDSGELAVALNKRNWKVTVKRILSN